MRQRRNISRKIAPLDRDDYLPAVLSNLLLFHVRRDLDVPRPGNLGCNTGFYRFGAFMYFASAFLNAKIRMKLTGIRWNTVSSAEIYSTN